jgi:hypothetical protein
MKRKIEERKGATQAEERNGGESSQRLFGLFHRDHPELAGGPCVREKM